MKSLEMEDLCGSFLKPYLGTWFEINRVLSFCFSAKLSVSGRYFGEGGGFVAVLGS